MHFHDPAGYLSFGRYRRKGFIGQSPGEGFGERFVGKSVHALVKRLRAAMTGRLMERSAERLMEKSAQGLGLSTLIRQISSKDSKSHSTKTRIQALFSRLKGISRRFLTGSFPSEKAQEAKLAYHPSESNDEVLKCVADRESENFSIDFATF
jgi:hypothetical protein